MSGAARLRSSNVRVERQRVCALTHSPAPQCGRFARVANILKRCGDATPFPTVRCRTDEATQAAHTLLALSFLLVAIAARQQVACRLVRQTRTVCHRMNQDLPI